MADFKVIEDKWRKKWDAAKAFEANASPGRKKFMLTFPYPYMNGFLHIGHFYTLMRVEALARFKRSRGYNVLFPQGWHCTGSPIESAAQRIREGEEKQIENMRKQGFRESEIKQFSDPVYWTEFFPKEGAKDYKKMGISIDARRGFITTGLNPYYDAFIKWQFKRLKEKGYVDKGRHPVAWCPKDNNPVPDHSRAEGEGETPQEFLLFRHRTEDGNYIMTATLRHDTILGITNLFVSPKFIYAIVEVNDEKWIISEPCIQKLKDQGYNVKKIGEIKGELLIGKKTEEFDKSKVLILPADFLDENIGTGMVHSVPSDSPDDLIALRDLQKDEAIIKRYKLNAEEIKKIKPIPVLNTPDYGSIAAEKMLEKFKITSQNQREKLEHAKKELYKLSFYSSTMNDKYKKNFSKDLSGLKASEAKEIIKEELLEKGYACQYYELTGKVVCRCLTEAVVKIVTDQWFIKYGDKGWKEKAHHALNKLKLYPDKAREQFEYVIDWLNDWACTREFGLGTKLPWDEKWIIESLSDSTIYNAYYTIAHLIEKVPLKEVTDELFDYVFLGRKEKPKVKDIEKMHKEFNYWYPVDFRNSGKDLIQNHLAFYIFNHVALFPEEKWPKGIGVNGWVTVDGQKMSKSLGNMILLRDMAEKFSVDASRLTILSGGESLDDPNWDSDFAKSAKMKLEQFFDFCLDNYGKGHEKKGVIDHWMESRLNESIAKVTELMEETLFRSASQGAFFELNKAMRWYLKRCNNKPNKEVLSKVIESQIMMMAPFTPFLCEELWERLGKKGFISAAGWPYFDKKKVNKDLDANEEMIAHTIVDIQAVKNLAKVEKLKKITLFVAENWKYRLFADLKKIMESTRNTGEIMRLLLEEKELKKYSKEISKIVPRFVIGGKLPVYILSQEKEVKALDDAKLFFREEYDTEVDVVKEQESTEQKAKNAMPGKVAIIVA